MINYNKKMKGLKD